MIELGILRLACVIGFAGTVGASASIVTEQSLVPISILVACVTTAVLVAWKVSSMVTNFKRDLKDLRKDMEKNKN